MDEIKFIKSLLFSCLGLGAYFALQHYVFKDDEVDVWAVAFIPIGREILKLIWKYYQIWEKRNETGLVYLKETKFELSDTVWILVTIAFVFYVRMDLIQFVIPLAVINCYLLYKVKKHQIYYFDTWSIDDLIDSNRSISARNILSMDIESNKLVILYVEDEYDDKDDEDDREKLIIQRQDLHSPRSWYQFEQIVRNFEETLKEKRAEYQQKTAILDS